MSLRLAPSRTVPHHTNPHNCSAETEAPAVTVISPLSSIEPSLHLKHLVFLSSYPRHANIRCAGTTELVWRGELANCQRLVPCK
ncbi:hypothetical protein RRG08_010363 [Elysia crispata]|uniref:Uncharacterized protein n=1 Tax=Elysia crispata TaxID=231223 RepID=A0AAE0Z2U5_9GAST|nr:hypothetical protein RRG08_010363 [Elysia crispata]